LAQWRNFKTGVTTVLPGEFQNKAKNNKILGAFFAGADAGYQGMVDAHGALMKHAGNAASAAAMMPEDAANEEEAFQVGC
jgi:hypothetical protein